MIGLLVSIPVGLVLMASSLPAIRAIGFTISDWWMLGFFIWTLLVHSRRRWPNKSLTERLAAFVPHSHSRDDHTS